MNQGMEMFIGMDGNALGDELEYYVLLVSCFVLTCMNMTRCSIFSVAKNINTRISELVNRV